MIQLLSRLYCNAKNETHLPFDVTVFKQTWTALKTKNLPDSVSEIFFGAELALLGSDRTKTNRSPLHAALFHSLLPDLVEVHFAALMLELHMLRSFLLKVSEKNTRKYVFVTSLPSSYLLYPGPCAPI